MNGVSRQWRHSHGSLRLLHVHALLAVSPGAGYRAQSGTDRREGRAAVRETAHHTGTATDFPVEPFNARVATNSGPALIGKIEVGKRLLSHRLSLGTRRGGKRIAAKVDGAPLVSGFWENRRITRNRNTAVLWANSPE